MWFKETKMPELLLQREAKGLLGADWVVGYFGSFWRHRFYAPQRAGQVASLCREC